MKKLSLSVLASIIALSVSACGAEESTAPAATKTANAAATAPAKKEVSDLTFNDKVAVSMGYMYGQNIANGINELKSEFDIAIDNKLLIKSFNEAVEGKTASLSEDDMRATMQEFDNIIRKKVEEKRAVEEEKHAAEAAKNLKAGQEFLEKNKTNEGVVETKTGLQYKINTLGTGKTPAVTDTIKVNYRGTTIDGNVFDESKEPVEFPLRSVIQGWIEAFQLLPVGTKATLYIPANLAYGENSPSPAIPSNSVLIFDVELLDIVTPEQK
jgi:FKBP-type peptidyl-prolyl cis-trans isomerase